MDKLPNFAVLTSVAFCGGLFLYTKVRFLEILTERQNLF